MVTNAQLMKKRRFKKRKKNASGSILQQSPQKKGVCLKVFTRTPKKPNSALRKVARILLSTGDQVTAHIPGEGHNLQEYSNVLVRGAKIRDLPGVRFRVIRGVYDCDPVQGRKKGRSKYGVKRQLFL